MATSIVIDLPVYSAIRNPIKFKVLGSEFAPGAVERPIASITFNVADMPADGDTMTLNAGVLGDPVVFTFRTVPDYTANELPVYSSGSYANYYTAVADALSLNYLVNTNYYVVVFSVADPVYLLIIAARTLSNDFNINQFSTEQDIALGVVGYTPLSNTSNPFVPFVMPSNAAMVLQLEVYTSYPAFTPVIILEEAYTPDLDGSVMFDPSDALRSLLSPYVPSPTIMTNRSAYSAMTTYRVFACERYGDPSESYALTATPWRFAYLAGRDEIRRINTPVWADEIHASGNYKFLSIWGNNSVATAKRIMTNQVEYLSWIYPASGPSTIRVKCDIYYESGDPTLSRLLDTVNAKYNELLVSPVGAGPLQLADLDTDRRILYYRVYLTNSSNTVISEYRYYAVDHRYHEWVEQMIWWGSNGSVETIALLGSRERSSDGETITSSRFASFPANLQTASDTSTRTRRIDTVVSQGTAYLREGEIAVLNDLLASESIHVLRGTEWVPVQSVNKRGIDLAADGEGIASRSIEYRIALTNTASPR